MYYQNVVMKDYWFKGEGIKDKECVDIAYETYQARLLTKRDISLETQKIPNLIHFIWVGSNPQPQTFTDYFLPQWQHSHPDFTFKVWTEQDLDTLELVNARHIRDKSLNPGFRADLLRLEILFIHGGIYIDADMA